MNKQPEDVFLLVGQSNMAGRGRLDDVLPLRDPDVLMWRDGKWAMAEEPLHVDKPDIAGVGLGMSFATDYHSKTGRSIGLLPCAVGGTRLDRWEPGRDLFNTAVSVKVEAIGNRPVTGLLWHQGEGDSADIVLAESYATRFRAMVDGFRSVFKQPLLPVVAGELGSFLENREGLTHYDVVNRQLQSCSERLSAFALVMADGLSCNGDALHFNSASLREFGLRYARAWFDLTMD